MNQKYVIMGNGPAGVSALETILKNEPQSHVTVLGNEKHSPYSRILIAYYLEDRVKREKIFIYEQKELLDQPSIEMKYPVKVKKVDVDSKYVINENKERIGYDKLLIATGASPKIPGGLSIENQENVFTVRNLDDVDSIKKSIKDAKHCLFIGGGMITLKLAQALRNNGIKVDIVVSGKHIVSQRLDSQSAEVISQYLKSKGINILTGENPVRIMQKDNNKKLVLFSSRHEIETDMVIIGKGVEANHHFIDQKKIDIGKGILVDQYLRTSCPDIFAAGDVVEIREDNQFGIKTNQIWPNAVEQGRIAALNMMGNKITYRGNIEMNALHLFDLPLVSIGRISEEADDFYVTERCEDDKICFQKFFFRDDKLIGLILIGPNHEDAGVYKQFILNNKKIINKRDFFKNPQDINCLV